MRFNVEIELGNDAMLTYHDIREALELVARNTKLSAHAHRKPTDGDGSRIRDMNGNTVGSWGVKADASSLASLAPELYRQLGALCGQIEATNGRFLVPPGCAEVLRNCADAVVETELETTLREVINDRLAKNGGRL